MFSSLERKHHIWAATALAVLLVAATIIAFFIAPKVAHSKIIDTLARAGFETSFIKQPRVAFGALLYEDIAFDQDAFSTAKFIKVTYNPFLLTLLGKFSDIDIIDLNLSGEWSTQHWDSVTFTGWKTPRDLSGVPLSSFNHINISRSRLSLLTQTAGVFSVFFDGTSNRNGSKTEFQGNIKSEQKYLSLDTNASGVIEGNRWFADIEIMDGKFEDPAGDFKTSRLSGWLNIAYAANAPLKIMSQLRAGGMTLYSIPWQAASSTVDYSNNDLKVFTEAKSVGYEGLELELNIFKKAGAALAAGGSIHAERPATLYEYFGQQQGFKNFLKDLDPYKTGTEVDIDYLMTGARKFRYDIRQNGQSTGVNGDVMITETEKPANKP